MANLGAPIRGEHETSPRLILSRYNCVRTSLRHLDSLKTATQARKHSRFLGARLDGAWMSTISESVRLYRIQDARRSTALRLTCPRQLCSEPGENGTKEGPEMFIFHRSIPPPSRHRPAFSRHSDHTHVPSAILVTPPEAISHTRRTRTYRMRFSMAGCGRVSDEHQSSVQAPRRA